jgi:hypothetical protein
MMHSLIGTLNSQKAAAAGGGGGFDSYVKSLLHFSGALGAQVFVDETGKTWTAYGSASTDTTQKKFGVSSGYFPGSGCYIDTPAHTDFNVGSGKFTFDLWVRRANTGGTPTVFAKAGPGLTGTISMRLYFDNANKPRMTVCDAASNSYTTAAGATAVVDDGVFHHIAAVKGETLMTLYLDGIGQGSVDMTGVTVYSSAYKFAIGRYGEYNGSYFYGWVDEFRFSNGIDRWTDDFIPWAQEYAA